MSAINWVSLGAFKGEYLESWVATCLCKRYRDARQTRPASGDGGVDVLRETPEGIHVWQVKQYVAPPNPGQWTRIKESWQVFWHTYVEAGRAVVNYELVTPWTPTESALARFREMTVEAPFETHWRGETFLNGLVADFRADFELFTKGDGFVESQVLAKSVLAASPVESTDGITMLDAINSREGALQSIRDMFSNHYYVDPSIRTMPNGEELDPTTLSGGVGYRIKRLSQNRWKIETIVPKTDQSLELEPIRFNTRFTAQRGSPQEKELSEFQYWGKPFSEVTALAQTIGGPFADAEPTEGLISFVATAPAPGQYPDLRWTHADGSSNVQLELEVAEVTQGPIGGGTRVLSRSRSGIVTIEWRFGSTEEEAPDSVSFEFDVHGGHDAVQVSADLDAFVALSQASGSELVIEPSTQIARMSGSEVPQSVRMLRQVAEDLVVLQPYAPRPLTMPDVSTYRESDFATLTRLARIYAGEPVEVAWERPLTIIVPDLEALQGAVEDATEHGCIARVEPISLVLSDGMVELSEPLLHLMCTPTIAGTLKVPDGWQVDLMPGGDPRHVVVRGFTGIAEPPSLIPES